MSYNINRQIKVLMALWVKILWFIPKDKQDKTKVELDLSLKLNGICNPVLSVCSEKYLLQDYKS